MPENDRTRLRRHWDEKYRANGPEAVSWFQPRPDASLALIAASGEPPHAGVIDVGGGASTLVDALLAQGYAPLAVLDLSGAALALSRERLGATAESVDWIEADVTAFTPPRRFGIWHDRAVFHFLTAAVDRRRYLAALRRTLRPGGTAVIATFAPDGPRRCSGLDVVRYDRQRIVAELGPEFALEDVRRETHITPRGREQAFLWFRLRRTGEADRGAPQRIPASS